MTSFEFYFSFFGLLLGLSVAEVATGFARTFKSRGVVRRGWLTPLLGVLVLLDISSFWVVGWHGLQGVPISHATIYSGLVVALAYYLAASLVFPDKPEEWGDLDDYYDRHKRLVILGVVVSNGLGFAYRAATGGLADFGAFATANTVVFFVILGLLLIARGRRINAILLVLHCLTNLSAVLRT